jgi:aminopeptidase N
MHKLCCPAIIASLLGAVPVLSHATEPDTDFRVVRYALEITPDIPAKSVVGRETITLRSLKEGLHTVLFSGNTLVIDSATLDGRPVHTSVTPKLTSLTLPDALPQGYSAVLRISYHGAADRYGFRTRVGIHKLLCMRMDDLFRGLPWR